MKWIKWIKGNKVKRIVLPSATEVSGFKLIERMEKCRV